MTVGRGKGEGCWANVVRLPVNAAGLLVSMIFALSFLLAIPGRAAADLTWSTSTTADQTLVNTHTGAEDSGLLSCASGNMCVAFGTSRPHNSETVTGDELTFDPTDLPAATHTVQAQTSADDPDSRDYLTSDACPSTTVCLAVSASGDGATFNPKSPGVVTATTVLDKSFYAESGTSGLVDVVCPAVNECVGLDPTGYAVTVDPHTLSKATTASIVLGPAPIIGVQLTSLACPDRTQCTATGASQATGEGVEITFDPKSPGPRVPVTLASAGLGPLACPSDAQCTAGMPDGSVVTFDPATGAPIGPPVPVDAAGAMKDGTGLGAIICLSATDCIAVDAAGGVFEGDPVTGAPWQSDPIAGTTTPGHLGLDALACPATTECVAIGAGGMVATGSLGAGPSSPPGSTSPGGSRPANVAKPRVQGRFTSARGGRAGLLIKLSRLSATLGLRTVVITLPRSLSFSHLSRHRLARSIRVTAGGRRIRFTVRRAGHRLTIRLARTLEGSRLTITCSPRILSVPPRLIHHRARARLSVQMLGRHRAASTFRARL